jgi:glyoxylase-like metal-dependent hydrolase (beta-lactamase superfamily II)
MSRDRLLNQIDHDIFQVRLPLPFALRIVNCYLLSGDDGWTMIDTGLNTGEGRASWEAVFEQLEIGPGDLNKIVLTHVHPDHLGMAGWLQRRLKRRVNGAMPPVFASAREVELFSEFWHQNVDWESELAQFWLDCGVPSDLAATMTESTAKTRRRTLPHPEKLQVIDTRKPVKMGERLLQPLLMPGHSDGQLIFYDPSDRLLFSGDHVLLKITPNIGLWPRGEADPLGRYLATFPGLVALDVRLSLPGHRAIITDLRSRVMELDNHHRERLDHTLVSATPSATVYETSQQIFPFGDLSVHERRFAIAETLAHLERLVFAGRLLREERDCWIYRAA